MIEIDFFNQVFCNLIVNALIVFRVLFAKDRKDPRNDSHLDCMQFGGSSDLKCFTVM